jgi:transcriptional regulator with XRE-family HTH domain
MENGRGFGAALRAQRRDRRLSLQEVSTATGISASFLSLVENDKSDITLGRLMKLASFFDVHVSDLLPPGAGRDPIVIRTTERRHIASPSEGMDISLLAPDSERRMLPLIAEFEPGGHPAEMSQHEGEEFIYVLTGRILIEMDGHDPVALEPGDAAFYRADRAHMISALDDASASLIAVASPPHL